LRKQKGASRRLRHSTTFHCSERLLFDNNTRADTSARMSCSEQGFGRKRTHKSPPTFFFTCHVSKAKRRLPRVGYLNLTTGLMATTPFPGVSWYQSVSDFRLAAHCVVLFFLHLWGGFDQSLFSSHPRSPTPSFFFVWAHQPGVDPPPFTTPLHSTTLQAGSRRSHTCAA